MHQTLCLEPWRPCALAATHPFHGWLTDQRSLTARIAARCQKVSVRVITQKLAVPHPDESAMLGLRAGRLAWVREVVLMADGVPVVYARSVLPHGHERCAWGMFAGIGQRPLGEVLFSDPSIARGALSAKRLDSRDWRYGCAVSCAPNQAKRLWARRSCFVRKERRLLVCEVFLSGVELLEI